MINDITYVLQQVFFVIYIYIVINRICVCFETCATQKSIGNAYTNLTNEGWETLTAKVRSKEK